VKFRVTELVLHLLAATLFVEISNKGFAQQVLVFNPISTRFELEVPETVINPNKVDYGQWPFCARRTRNT
jgi:hypothetical protein